MFELIGVIRWSALSGWRGEARHVVIVVEKDSLRGWAELLAFRYGASLLVTGGQASLIGSEHLAGDLLPVLGGRPVVLVFLVDWDPPGWVIPQAQARQLEPYGVPVFAVRHLVRPERFTPEEIALFAHPLHPRGPSALGLQRRWLAETGGINGQALGLHADHFWPAERVLAAFLAEMAGLMDGAEASTRPRRDVPEGDARSSAGARPRQQSRHSRMATPFSVAGTDAN